MSKIGLYTLHKLCSIAAKMINMSYNKDAVILVLNEALISSLVSDLMYLWDQADSKKEKHCIFNELEDLIELHND